MTKETTKEKIIEATIALIYEKGFKGTTTQLIAKKAGVNESTLFRHFGSKKGIMQEVIGRYSYVSMFSNSLKQEVTWDLEKDLYTFIIHYQKFMHENKDYILIGMQEAHAFPEMEEMIATIPKELKQLLTTYLEEMYKRGKLIKTDFEAQALNIIWLNFGAFLSRARLGNLVTDMDSERFARNSVGLFSRALTP
ncbi:TetR/AcrR family transcriptional regulator [Bacillus songklensis]|uniref:TetR/AcrR family transcriptional regulator n=1 Tax=Bacillus songklensis TaxID=1069116 RepID=A0ABV8B721_9BACI